MPDEKSNIVSFSLTKNTLILNKITNVRSELHSFQFKNGEWMSKKVDAPDAGTISVVAADDFSDDYFYTYADFLTPSTLFFTNAGERKTKKVRSLPDFFDSSGFEVDQREAVSKDGTRIPYFIVFPKNMDKDGSHPTLLYGYGGFEISQRPRYNSLVGSTWLERGGIFVVANIRGGGEFGPRWHQAALKNNRQRAYDDFFAISEALIQEGITSPEHLGIMGGRPDLYNAVVCGAPLLDMKRYNKLLAGASWMAEYGNPDIPGEWAFIRKYSPYHNVKGSVKYPKVFFTTTTRDDRVHPAHARKMVARMIELGHPVYYFENTEGGHGAGVTNEQRALMLSLEYAYLLKMLK